MVTGVRTLPSLLQQLVQLLHGTAQLFTLGLSICCRPLQP